MGSKEIVARIKALRKERGWSQQDLADKSGVSIATIKKIEIGQAWTSTIMDKINEALDGCVY